MSFVHDLFFDYTLRTVALGSALFGLVAGSLGSFAMLRRQSLLGDAISHAALPGIALAFILTGAKDPMILALGAGVSGWLGMLVVIAITGSTRLKTDSALGIVLSVFFGLGLVLITYLQQRPDSAQAGLDQFLFGQAATLVGRDVVLIAGLGGTALTILALFWKEFALLTFDRDFGASLGFPMARIETGLAAVLVAAIVVGLQAVGVVLMSAMVVAPAAAARQWTNRLGTMVLLAGAFGAVSGFSGALISSVGEGLPTGPLIVIMAGTIVAASLLFAPGRGLVSQLTRAQRNRRRMHLETVLEDLYALSHQHADPDYAHPESSLIAMRPWRGRVGNTLARLATQGFVRETGRGWAVTPAGLARGRDLALRAGGGS